MASKSTPQQVFSFSVTSGRNGSTQTFQSYGANEAEARARLEQNNLFPGDKINSTQLLGERQETRTQSGNSDSTTYSIVPVGTSTGGQININNRTPAEQAAIDARGAQSGVTVVRSVNNPNGTVTNYTSDGGQDTGTYTTNSDGTQTFHPQAQASATAQTAPSAPRTVDYSLHAGESIADYTNRVASERNTIQAQGGASNTETSQYNLSPDDQAIYDQLKGYLDKLQANGQSINPDVQITGQQTADFLNQAASEINPYYQDQLKTARDTLLRSLGYSEDQILKNEQDLQTSYQKADQGLTSSAAENGTAQSGQRVLDESNLATATQASIDSGRAALANTANNAAATFAQNYGTKNLPDSTITGAPQVAAGATGFTSSNGSAPVYQLSDNVYDGLVGTNEYNRRAAVQSRASQLEQAFRGTAANNQSRQIQLA